jgi:hypothetical protein
MLSHAQAERALLALAPRQQSVLFGRLVHRSPDGKTWSINNAEPARLLVALDQLLGEPAKGESYER